MLMSAVEDPEYSGSCTRLKAGLPLGGPRWGAAEAPPPGEEPERAALADIGNTIRVGVVSMVGGQLVVDEEGVVQVPRASPLPTT